MNAEPADPTELAGVAEMHTEAAEAWSLDDADEDYPLTGSWQDPERRWTPRRVTVLAVVASVVAIAAVGGLAAWKLRDQNRSSAPDKLMVVVATETATTVVAVPAPVTVTQTAKALPPPAPSRTSPLPARQFSAIDRAFISRLVNDGWHITSADAMVTNAHVVCTLVHQGASLEYVNNRVANDAAVDMIAASMFTAAAMQTYPDCP
ncbi:DUF732 domain-containing protein [Mycolicibacterium sphagni]|uniref:DUF732 domain-containing protein n=1 Tax=Mycolicibacterium sphagni TaxID=1786 RepID=A0ABX2JQ28_9MYCO|nr:DUF732 domain-containing protein [Mycolicibacterium sphagni]NTY58668.1 DUF732 domain-containing protein [Mycolicibacterium sphagni]